MHSTPLHSASKDKFNRLRPSCTCFVVRLTYVCKQEQCSATQAVPLKYYDVHAVLKQWYVTKVVTRLNKTYGAEKGRKHIMSEELTACKLP